MLRDVHFRLVLLQIAVDFEIVNEFLFEGLIIDLNMLYFMCAILHFLEIEYIKE